MKFITPLLLTALILWPFPTQTVSGGPPIETALTEQIRAALIEPDPTLADAMAAYDPEIPSRLSAAINLLSLGADPSAFIDQTDPYLATVQQLRVETPLLNLTAEQIEERVQFHELNRTGFVMMTVRDRPSPTGDLVDLDPQTDFLVVVINFWNMRIGTLPVEELFSWEITLHPVLTKSGLPELSTSRACHLGAFGAPPRGLSVFIVPPDNIE